MDRLIRRAGAFRLAAAVAIGLIAATAVAAARAIDLQPATRLAFDAYVAAVEARIARELAAGRGFLGSDFGDAASAASTRQALLDGGMPIARLQATGADGKDLSVPDGIVHHWRGAVLVPGARLDPVLKDLQSPDPRRYVQDDVLEFRMLSQRGDEAQVFLKLVRRSIVTVTYNTEHAVRFVRLTPDRAHSRSVATRIAEIENAGTPQERELPVGRDRGFLWRMNSYWRYERVPQGVLVELESVTLSRDLPGAVRFVAGPIIDSVARDSIERTLRAVRLRLESTVAGGSQP